MRRSLLASIVFVGALAPLAAAHNHVTVDTEGFPGGQIFIVAGYLPAESAFTIEKGVLLWNGELAEYAAPDDLNAGPFAGWLAGDELSLTSDFFFGSGNLDGGNFLYEFASVTPVAGGPCEIAWGKVQAGAFVASAISSGATRLERSFDVGIGGHIHGQVMAVSAPGTYDVTLIAWDSNGVYTDSDPMTFRVSNPAGPADLNADGVVDGADLGLLLGAWGPCAGTPCVGDLNGDGVVDGADLGVMLGAWT